MTSLGGGTVTTLQFLDNLESLVVSRDYPENAILSLLYKASGKQFNESKIYSEMFQLTKDARFSHTVQVLYNTFYGRNPVFEEVLLEAIQTAKGHLIQVS